jgi:hypothetical protein
LKPGQANGLAGGRPLSVGYRQSNRLLWSVGLLLLPLVLIWFVGVLGYQILLRLLERDGVRRSAGAGR